MIKTHADLAVERGATFTQTIKWLCDDEPMDMNLYEVTACVANPSTNKVVALMECDIDPDRPHVMTLTIPKTITKNLKAGVYRWDLALTDASGTVEKPLYGLFRVLFSATGDIC